MSFDLVPHLYFTLPDGGRLRYAQLALTMNPKGTVLIVPGAREFIEKKFIELGKPLMDQGFRVVIYEPRGQGLSSRFVPEYIRQRGHIDDFSTHLDDLRAFYAEIISRGVAAPLIVHGHSLGAHILLRWLAEDRPNVAGAFLTSPMIALSGMASYMMGYGLSWAGMALFGQETSYAPMQHDFGGEDLFFEGNPLTHDEERFKLFENYFSAHPELTTGGVTWGWMLAALRSMNVMHTWPYLSKIEAPILSLAGDQDILTPASEVAPFLNIIPRARPQVIPGARHDLLSETGDLRREAWRHIDEFLNQILLKHKAEHPEKSTRTAA